MARKKFTASFLLYEIEEKNTDHIGLGWKTIILWNTDEKSKTWEKAP